MIRLLAAPGGALGSLILSGALGFWLGIAAFPQWQVAVETAQVIARLVTYPPDNPFHIYHARLWTVLHEIVAVLLRSGVSEITASRVLSGVLGMVSLQALAMLVYAFSRDALFATASTFVVLMSRAAEFGGRYPISLMGTDHTYGAYGLASVALAVGLLGAGCVRLGGLLLGVLPAIHPSMGVWTFLIVALALASDFTRLRTLFRPALPWFVVGCTLTAVSLAAHLAIAPAVPDIDTTSTERVLPKLIEYWDGHRKPASLQNRAVYLNFAVLPLAIVWLRWLGGRLPAASMFILRFAAVSATLAIAFVFVSWAPPGSIPDIVQILMPLRLLNFMSMMFAAVLLGLAGTSRQTLAGQIGMTAVMVALLLGQGSHFWGVMPVAMPAFVEALSFHPMQVMIAGAIAISALTLVLDRRGVTSDPERERLAPRLTAVVRTVATAAVVACAVVSMRPATHQALRFRDRTHDPVFAAAAAADGMLLPAHGLRLIQLRTRRPTLVDPGGFDGLPYSMEAAPAMISTLRDVYDIDLLSPPSIVPEETNRYAWERYPPERWQDIRRKYNVTQVITPRTWRLDLPIVAETLEMRLYDIPR